MMTGTCSSGGRTRSSGLVAVALQWVPSSNADQQHPSAGKKGGCKQVAVSEKGGCSQSKRSVKRAASEGGSWLIPGGRQIFCMHAIFKETPSRQKLHSQ